MNKIVVALLEGQHDVAFVSRVLKSRGYEDNASKIQKLQTPFNDLFGQLLANESLQDRKFGYKAPTVLVPSAGLKYQDTLVFLHSVGGDANRVKRKEIYQEYLILSGSDEESFEADFDFSFKFLWLFDADNIGVDARIEQINQECSDLCGQTVTLSHGTVLQIETTQGNVEFGAYVFHDVTRNDKTGKLEDQIKQLIAANDENQPFLNDAAKFVEISPNAQTPRYDKDKAQLGSLCQLEIPGVSNSVFILKSGFLSDKVLVSDSQCTMIADLFD